MLEGLRGYVQMAVGLTEVTTARAREVAGSLLTNGAIPGVPASTSAMAVQVAGLAEDLIDTARNNRGALVELVRAEVESAVHKLGVVTSAEADDLRARVAALEAELDAARAAPAPRARSSASAGTSAAKRTAGKRSTGKRTAGTKTATKPTSTPEQDRG